MNTLTSFAPSSLSGSLQAEIEMLSSGFVELEFKWDPSWILADVPTEKFSSSNCKRKKELWTTTCFEAFIKPVGESGYWELNISPDKKWNAFRFESYRDPNPIVEAKKWRLMQMKFEPGSLKVKLQTELQTSKVYQVGLTAVLATPEGEKSYWSVAWPKEKTKPDFHSPSCYAIERKTK